MFYKIYIMKSKRNWLVAAFIFMQAPLAAQEKPQVLFTGTPWSVMGVSTNGRWICGTRMYEQVYRFDTETRKLEVIRALDGDCLSAAFDMMDDGTIVGINDFGEPSLYRNKDWEPLPRSVQILPGDASLAASCTGDGQFIVGHLSVKSDGSKPYKVIPMMWKLKADGTYEDIVLPEPATDFLGTSPQFVSLRSVSTDGKRITGLIVNRTGFYPMPIVYRQGVDNEWNYEMPFVDIMYDMDKFPTILAESPDLKDYVTVTPTDPEYREQVREFEKAFNQWRYKLYTEGQTGKKFSSVPAMSDNGKFLVGSAGTTTYSLEENVIVEETKAYPAYYNLETREYVELEQVGDVSPAGITNEGDIIATDGYDIFLIMHDHPAEKISMTQWLKDAYDFDLAAVLPSNMDTNSAQAISGDGKLMVGRYVSVTEDGELDNQEVYCILLPKIINGIIEALNTESIPQVYAEGGRLHMDREADNIHIFDMAGNEVLRVDGKTRSVDISALKGGIYVVKAFIDGKEIKSKIINQ